MNIEKAFRLPFSEDGLVKVIIGAVLNLIPIVNFLSMGYLLELTGNVIQGREDLPAWEDWGGKFIKGLMVAVIAFIYMFIPMLVMMLGGGAAAFAGSAGGSIFFALIGFLLCLVVWFILPMALTNFAATGNFGSAFAFGEIFGMITGALGQYLTVFGISIAGGFVLGIIGMIPLLGWIVLLLGGFYIGLVICFLLGQVYRSVGGGA
ncbi:MAG: DUF4013 domain-containing protein [Firmicutes bacterium]|nr:DUF4013 domain-containing protein [Bacillota bacterium]